jgi:hypothetical protein
MKTQGYPYTVLVNRDYKKVSAGLYGVFMGITGAG